MVFSGLVEYCAVLHISKIQQKILLPQLSRFKKKDKVVAKSDGQVVRIGSSGKNVEDQTDAVEVRVFFIIIHLKLNETYS